MNPFLKQIVILTTVFVFILWYQNVDDKRTKRVRKTNLEKFKLPILVTSIVGLLININIYKLLGLEQCNITHLTFLSPQETPNLKSLIKPKPILKPFLPIPDNVINIPKLNSLDITDQDIYTDLPDF